MGIRALMRKGRPARHTACHQTRTRDGCLISTTVAIPSAAQNHHSGRTVSGHSGGGAADQISGYSRAGRWASACRRSSVASGSQLDLTGGTRTPSAAAKITGNGTVTQDASLVQASQSLTSLDRAAGTNGAVTVTGTYVLTSGTLADVSTATTTTAAMGHHGPRWWRVPP
jgi:hypothetical protein